MQDIVRQVEARNGKVLRSDIAKALKRMKGLQKANKKAKIKEHFERFLKHKVMGKSALEQVLKTLDSYREWDE